MRVDTWHQTQGGRWQFRRRDSRPPRERWLGRWRLGFFRRMLKCRFAQSQRVERLLFPENTLLGMMRKA